MNYTRLRLIFGAIICFLLIANCSTQQANPPKSPNILWIYLEDTSPLLPSYGTNLIETPNIDELANAGTVYSNAFMPAPVCSASRSTIITGTMSTTLGHHNHHSSRTVESAILLPDSIKTIPELFKSNGYFTFNNGKDDYNFAYNRKELYDQPYRFHPLYGKSGLEIPISELTDKQPFFGQIQLRGGKEIFSKSFSENVAVPVDRNVIELPPYLPEHEVIVEEYADHLDAIQITDKKVGVILEELRNNGLLDNTIVFFFSDHGMRLTRHKQFLYDGGIKVPLIISDFRAMGKNQKGKRNDDLISGIDLGTSSLALANIEIPDYMEGRNIFDPTLEPRAFVISTRDRCDFTIDRIRSVRSKKFKYIRNFMTDRPYTQTTYMDIDKVPFVITMKELFKEGKLNEVQARFMVDFRPEEEFYDIVNDPFELNNLAENPNYIEQKSKYALILNQWIEKTNDQGQYPETIEGLKFMLGVWGDAATNPEYDPLRKQFPDLAGSLVNSKTAGWKKAEN